MAALTKCHCGNHNVQATLTPVLLHLQADTGQGSMWVFGWLSDLCALPSDLMRLCKALSLETASKETALRGKHILPEPTCRASYFNQHAARSAGQRMESCCITLISLMQLLHEIGPSPCACVLSPCQHGTRPRPSHSCPVHFPASHMWPCRTQDNSTGVYRLLNSTDMYIPGHFPACYLIHLPVGAAAWLYAVLERM